ncbi:ribonuclease R [Abyssibius alkaniclasticus]|uniref:ribonuclease R n=1 Tax=Abyssibius alkaniclasticus TaxID=2881234 RepID=UPI0023645899|nr:ribonuclease R [Abyssibius alkaniclasticus]UPH72427.1 ribonuclease R [Abyssibius alkaniclasticus]
MNKMPSKNQLLEFIRENPGAATKRDIAKAFGIKGAARIELKAMLRALGDEGHLEKKRRSFADPDVLAPVAVLVIDGQTSDGELLASPAVWTGKAAAPRALVLPNPSAPALARGDRVLAKTEAVDAPAPITHHARPIRRIAQAAARIVGVFRQADHGGRILPVGKGQGDEYQVAVGDRNGARDGELVEAEPAGPKNRMGLRKARIVARIGDPSAPKAVSLIAIHEHGIPDTFPDEVIEAAAAAEPVELGKRTDLRHLPLITIDPADARDRDDAVAAMADDNPANPGGHILWVAIADVAHYVRPGSPLDREALKRGNSCYFPDRVVPMLPDALSGDLCSLHGDVDRPCIALRIVLNAQGARLGHEFKRGLMRSHAALSYEQAQAAADGYADAATAPVLESAIKPLWAAYKALQAERDRRQPLHLDLPERKIVLDEAGQVTSVAFRDRFDAHKLIEECMVLANVCAAETLETARQPLLYRVHEEPAVDKLEALREVVGEVGLTLAKGQVLQTRHLNRLLDAAAGGEFAEMVNMSVLRSMTQAYYAPQNFGHFGLNLRRYAHFTSPIRRYADLIVHRALITVHDWGRDGLPLDQAERLADIGTAVSATERRAMVAERDTTDRYLAAYLAERVGTEMDGMVSGVARFGLFVRLDETGADGLVPISAIGHEYFQYDADAQTLKGEKSGRLIAAGMRARVRLAEAVPITGGLAFDLLELQGKPIVAGPRGRGAGGPKRKLVRAKIKRDKAKRKPRK